MPKSIELKKLNEHPFVSRLQEDMFPTFERIAEWARIRSSGQEAQPVVVHDKYVYAVYLRLCDLMSAFESLSFAYTLLGLSPRTITSIKNLTKTKWLHYNYNSCLLCFSTIEDVALLMIRDVLLLKLKRDECGYKNLRKHVKTPGIRTSLTKLKETQAKFRLQRHDLVHLGREPDLAETIDCNFLRWCEVGEEHPDTTEHWLISELRRSVVSSARARLKEEVFIHSEKMQAVLIELLGFLLPEYVFVRDFIRSSAPSEKEPATSH